MTPNDERRAVEQVVDRLSGQVPGTVRPHVMTVVQEVHHEFDDARIRDFVPIIVERVSRERLELLV